MTVVIGTAGHIDHGKTSLLRALTGIDADRLPEERARGMTIDVGYAHLVLEDGSELDFVDVPGHDRLVGNMLVGAGEIDAALLVVAADDGPRAQTREHLELLDALGIAIGLAVVTKVDAVEPERTAGVVAAVRELLASTSLASAQVLAASSVTRLGLDEVRTALLGVRDRVLAAARADPGPTRLAIDRVFSVRGRGTVVTGTLRGAPVVRGAILRIVPGPAGAAVRVREVQVHGRPVDRAGPGRTALNVVGSGAEAALERGVVLTADSSVVATDRLLVATRPAVADRSPVTVHLATSRVSGRVSAAARDGADLGDGRRAMIVRLERPVAAAPGDPFVLRRPSPAETLAGGVVLDPAPPRGVARRRSTPDRIRALADALELGRAPWAAARLDLHGIADAADGPVRAVDLVDLLDADLRAAVHDRGPIPSAALGRLAGAALRRHVWAAAGIDQAVASRIDQLVAAGELARHAGSVSVSGANPDAVSPALAAAMDRLVAALSVVAPPPLGAAATGVHCPVDGIRRLERDGRIVRLEDDLAWAAPVYTELAARAVELVRRGPLTPAAFRDATGTSRKYVMAILEDLDRRAILRRTPDGHVAGPRAATVRAMVEAGR